MRLLIAVGACALWLPSGAAAQAAFDACEVFTQADAERAMETAAAGDPPNPKAKRPKTVLACAYRGFKDGKPVEAKAQFRIARTDAESQLAFDEARLKHQTKPLLVSGAEAFWAGRSGEMHLRKGRTWVTLTVGPVDAARREVTAARKLAEALVPKL